MYHVTVKNGSVEYMLHHFSSQDEQIYGDTLSEEVGKTPTFSFMIAPDHPNIGQIYTLSSRILIYDDGELIFEGRVITPQSDLYNTGNITCVGALSFLADSMITPKLYSESISAFITEVVTNHNGMVEAGKQFTVGTVNVAGRTVEFEAGSYMDALSLLNAGLDGMGGYLHVRHQNSVRYLDYTYEYGNPNTQVVRFGENVLDIGRQKDGSEIITCLIPEGAEIEVQEPGGTVTKKRVDITSVAGGRKYITNQTGINAYGQIWGHAVFEEITQPSVLLTAATNYLNAQIQLPESIEVNALDLNLTDKEIASLKVGRNTTFISDVHGISGVFLLSKRETHITAPQNDVITFGSARYSVSGAVSDNAHAVNIKLDAYKQQARSDMQAAVQNATSLITGGQGGYIVFGMNASDGHPEELFIMDNPNKTQATNVIRLNRNGIGFSTHGINGPYTNAWTIDGNLVADFITTGKMSADRVKGGTMELGGTSFARDGSIKVYNASGTLIGTWDKNGIRILNGSIQGAAISGNTISGGSIQGTEISGGAIHGTSITGSEIEAGEDMFYASDEEVRLGPFYVYQGDSGLYLATRNQKVGMGTSEYFAFWAGGSGNNPPFYVDGNGGIWSSDMGSDWEGYTVGEAIKWIWDNWPGA